jgi:hypothetical protein
MDEVFGSQQFLKLLFLHAYKLEETQEQCVLVMESGCKH